MIAYSILFWMLIICSAVVETNAKPINFLKFRSNLRKSTVGPSPLINATTCTTNDSIVTATTVVSSGLNKRMTSRDVHVHVEKTSTDCTNAKINKLCSVLAQVIKENHGKVDGVTTAPDRVPPSPSVTIASRGRRKYMRPSSRKTFPLSSKTKLDSPSFVVQSMAPYRDPIVIQEVGPMDYVTSYTLEKEISGVGTENYDYKESDKPAMVWRTAEVGNAFGKYNDEDNADDNDADDS